MKSLLKWKAIFVLTLVFFSTALFSTSNAYAIGSEENPIEFTEKEPNETTGTAQKIDIFSEGYGELTDITDVDVYKFEMPAKGSFYAYSLLGNDDYFNELYADDYNIIILDKNGNQIGSSNYQDSYDEETGEVSHWQGLDIELEKGQYFLSIQSKNEDSDLEYEEFGLEFEEYYLLTGAEFDMPDFSIDSITTSLKAPQVVGKTINITANSKTKGLQYKFIIDGKVAKDFSTANVYAWKPSKAGNSKITVEARMPATPALTVSKQLSYEIKDGKVSISGVTPNLATPRPTNSTIRWTAYATGVDLQYKFSVYANKKWTVVQNFSAKNYLDWKPKTAGAYQVRVDVKSTASGKTAYKLSAGYNIFKPGNFSITSVTPSLKSPQFTGSSITFKPKASGQYLEYRYRINDGYGWYTARDFSSTANYTWRAPYSGSYNIAVDVRVRGTGTIKTKTISYVIKESPNFYMNSDYDIYSNYGTLKVQNKGYKNINVTKIEFLNNGKVIFTHTAKNFITIGQQTQDFYFEPKKVVTQFNYDTVIRIHYNYDGANHTIDLYRY